MRISAVARAGVKRSANRLTRRISGSSVLHGRISMRRGWLIFEAGALAKSVNEGRVVPLCIDLKSAEVTGPLSGFQGRALDRDGVKRLVQDLNEAAEKKMPNERLDGIFKAMWPELEAAVLDAIKAAGPDTKPGRSDKDMLAELVERVRHIDRLLNKEADAEPRIYFTRDYVKKGLLSNKTYPRGTTGIPTHVHTGEGDQITHIDVRLLNGDLLVEVPVEYFIPPESDSDPEPDAPSQP
jgi:hypothetical protein